MLKLAHWLSNGLDPIFTHERCRWTSLRAELKTVFLTGNSFYQTERSTSFNDFYSIQAKLFKFNDQTFFL